MSEPWRNVLELDEGRNRVGGDEAELCRAIAAGADLKIETNFRHNEHLDTNSENDELIREISEFRTTYVLDNRWTAGFMTLRQPVDVPVGFGKRPSLSLFLYNQNGQQAIARPYLDGAGQAGSLELPGDYRFQADVLPENMPKYHVMESWDQGTNAPSENFIYDFGVYRYWVNEQWQEVLSHDSEGQVLGGSLEALVDAFGSGREVKVGIRGICSDLFGEHSDSAMEHEVFVQVGFTYYYTQSKLFLGETHPIVRVKPSIPLRYESGNWDYGWLMPRTDGYVAMLLYDPYTLQYRRMDGQYAIRWLVK